MDRQQIEGYLQKVAAYRASGLKANEWAAANGVTVRQLASWSAHAARWQAKLDGVEFAPRQRRSSGQASFVAAVVPAAGTDTIKVEIAGAGAIVHWPASRSRELATWLREMRS